MRKRKLEVGDVIWSPYFGKHIRISRIISNDDWYFEIDPGDEMKAETPLSYFEDAVTGWSDR